MIPRLIPARLADAMRRAWREAGVLNAAAAEIQRNATHLPLAPRRPDPRTTLQPRVVVRPDGLAYITLTRPRPQKGSPA